MELQRQAMMTAMDIHMNQMKCNFLLMGDEKIHPGQIAMMMTLKYLGPSSQRTLAKKMNCSPASIGVSVKRLEKAGLVEKHAVEQDLRATRIMLTSVGEKLAERSEMLVNLLAEQKYAGFSEGELELLNQFLDRIKDNLEAYQDNLSKKKNEKEEFAAAHAHTRQNCRQSSEGPKQPDNQSLTHKQTESDQITHRPPEQGTLHSEGERPSRRERRGRRAERGPGNRTRTGNGEARGDLNRRRNRTEGSSSDRKKQQ